MNQFKDSIQTDLGPTDERGSWKMTLSDFHALKDPDKPENEKGLLRLQKKIIREKRLFGIDYEKQIEDRVKELQQIMAYDVQRDQVSASTSFFGFHDEPKKPSDRKKAQTVSLHSTNRGGAFRRLAMQEMEDEYRFHEMKIQKELKRRFNKRVADTVQKAMASPNNKTTEEKLAAMILAGKAFPQSSRIETSNNDFPRFLMEGVIASGIGGNPFDDFDDYPKVESEPKPKTKMKDPNGNAVVQELARNAVENKKEIETLTKQSEEAAVEAAASTDAYDEAHVEKQRLIDEAREAGDALIAKATQRIAESNESREKVKAEIKAAEEERDSCVVGLSAIRKASEEDIRISIGSALVHVTEPDGITPQVEIFTPKKAPAKKA